MENPINLSRQQIKEAIQVHTFFRWDFKKTKEQLIFEMIFVSLNLQCEEFGWEYITIQNSPDGREWTFKYKMLDSYIFAN